ncbi:LITAF-like zinc ribbon domain-containing protein [Ditylenchus destructor]|nr:LITAF-like zinc ribbon domain-containing protein [Ditylenchus destructor]
MSEMSSIDGTAKVEMERNAAYTSQHVPAPPPYCNPPLQFGTRPINCKCPHCHQQVVTNMQVQAGVFAWLIFSLFVIFGIVYIIALIVEHLWVNSNAFDRPKENDVLILYNSKALIQIY